MLIGRRARVVKRHWPGTRARYVKSTYKGAVCRRRREFRLAQPPAVPAAAAAVRAGLAAALVLEGPAAAVEGPFGGGVDAADARGDAGRAPAPRNEARVKGRRRGHVHHLGVGGGGRGKNQESTARISRIARDKAPRGRL